MALALSWLKRQLGITFELNADDIVVFVVGPPGGGKSGFIKAATDSPHIKVGKRLNPHTKNVRAIRCELNDDAWTALGASSEQKYIVFVDTPSFLNGTDNEKEAEENTNHWLRESRPKSTIVGTIYVDRVANVRPSESTTIQNHLDCFASTFRGLLDFQFSPGPRLRGILSFDFQTDRIEEHRIISLRDNLFQQQLRTVGSSPFQGGTELIWVTSSHPECLRRDKPEEAWKAVVALFSNRA